MTEPAGVRDTVTAREVATQPEIWARALGADPESYAALPAEGTPVLVVGCGTSYYVGDAYARLRESAGLGRTRAVIASELDRIGADANGKIVAPEITRYGIRLQGGLECTANIAYGSSSLDNWYAPEPR